MIPVAGPWAGRVPRRRLITITILVLYGLAVTAITVLPIGHPPSYWPDDPWWTVINWIPFAVDAPSFVLNIAMFMPFGVLVPVLWPGLDTVRRLARSALAASAAIELTQLVLGLTFGSRRTVDVNDLIANTAGALLGLLMLRLALPHAATRARLAPTSARRAASPP